MRQIYTSPRPENIDRVVALMAEHGIEATVANRSNYNRQSWQRFSYTQRQDNREPLKVSDLPPALYHRFVGVNGKFLIQIYPKDDVWERAPQERFVHELRTIAPAVTGTPVQLYEYETLLKDSYVEAAWYSLTAIALMVKHHAIEDTIGRARHYGAIATDALALVPPSEIKQALEETVAFCIARAH